MYICISPLFHLHAVMKSLKHVECYCIFCCGRMFLNLGHFIIEGRLRERVLAKSTKLALPYEKQNVKIIHVERQVTSKFLGSVNCADFRNAQG